MLRVLLVFWYVEQVIPQRDLSQSSHVAVSVKGVPRARAVRWAHGERRLMDRLRLTEHILWFLLPTFDSRLLKKMSFSTRSGGSAEFEAWNANCGLVRPGGEYPIPKTEWNA